MIYITVYCFFDTGNFWKMDGYKMFDNVVRAYKVNDPISATDIVDISDFLKSAPVACDLLIPFKDEFNKNKQFNMIEICTKFGTLVIRDNEWLIFFEENENISPIAITHEMFEKYAEKIS